MGTSSAVIVPFTGKKILNIRAISEVRESVVAFRK